jgi:hypothetical protein
LATPECGAATGKYFADLFSYRIKSAAKQKFILKLAGGVLVPCCEFWCAPKGQHPYGAKIKAVLCNFVLVAPFFLRKNNNI